VNVWRPHATPRHPRDNMDRVNFRRLTRHTSVTRPAMPKRSRLSAVARLKRKKIAAIAPLTRSQRLTQSSLVHDCGIASVCLPVCLSLSLSLSPLLLYVCACVCKSGCKHQTCVRQVDKPGTPVAAARGSRSCTPTMGGIPGPLPSRVYHPPSSQQTPPQGYQGLPSRGNEPPQSPSPYSNLPYARPSMVNHDPVSP